MAAPKQFSIRVRLIANTVLVCGAALSLAFASLVSVELISGRRSLIDEMGTIATIVGNNAAGAVTFDDAPYAESLLSGLKVRRDITRAVIHKRDGDVLATYERPGPGAHEDAPGEMALGESGLGEAKPDESNLGTGGAWGKALLALLYGDTPFVEVKRPIELHGEEIGQLYIRSDMSPMAATLELYVRIAGVGILLIFLASAGVSWRLHRSIYKDISDLVGAMAEIAGKGRYDIRARKNRDDELGYLVDGFNEMLSRLELRDVELREAMVRAEAANRAKSNFLAAVSHELRTPLNAIIGFSEVMDAQVHGPVGNETYAGYITDIRISGKHLLDLINDILDLSKIEAGKDEIFEEDFDPGQVVEETANLVRDIAQREGIEVATELGEDLPLLRADPRKVKQILLNLLSNAVKFTPAGGRVVQEVLCEADGGIAFRTLDTGIGIATDDVPKAMSVFGQIDDELNRKYEGTGLGLPLSVVLAEQHGGSLALDSSPGRGTTITVRFPPSRSLERTDGEPGDEAGDESAQAARG